MPTLANIQGRSLTPNINPALNTLLQGFGTPQTRAAQAQQLAQAQQSQQIQAANQKTLEESIAALTGGGPVPGAAPGAAPGTVQGQLSQQAATGKARQDALIRLTSINPQAAQGIQQIIAQGDAQALAAVQQETANGARMAKLIKGKQSFTDRQKALSDLAATAATQGKDLTRFVELSNMSEGQLDVELDKMLLQATDIATITEPVKASTAIGKAQEDLRAGLITQEQFNTLATTPPKFQTDVGKAIGDQQLAIAAFGEGSPQALAFTSIIADAKSGKKEVKLSDVAGIRKEHAKISAPFILMQDSFGKIEQSHLNPSAAGDVSLIFNFMKTLDPGSVVRESEFALAQAADSLTGNLRSHVIRMMEGQRLNPEQRQDFIDTARRNVESQATIQRRHDENFTGIAKRAGIDPANVVLDYNIRPIVEEETIVEPEAPGPIIVNPVTGERQQLIGGKWQKI